MLKQLLGDPNARKLRRYNPLVLDINNLEEDLTQRLIHYAAIKKLSMEIFGMTQNGKDFLIVRIKNNFSISSKIVPKISLQDIILKYLIINKILQLFGFW